MAIKKLNIQNFMGIEEKEIDIEGKINVIKGKNGAGKSSIIEAIEKLITNNDRRTESLRHGAEKGFIFIQTDDGKELRRNLKSNSLTYKNDGEKVAKAQTVLNELVGAYAFNPVDFINEDSKKQNDLLLNSLDLELTEEMLTEKFGEDWKTANLDLNKPPLEIIKDLQDYFYNERKEINRQIKDSKNSIKETEKKLPENYDYKKWENVKMADLYEELNKISEYNEKINQAKSYVKEAEFKISEKNKPINDEINDINFKIKELENKKKELEKQKETNEKNIKETVKEMEEFLKNNELKDSKEIKEKVKKTDEMRTFINMAKNIEGEKELLKDKEKAKNIYEDLLSKARELPEELLSKAKMPIKGLSVKDGNVTINGLTIDNLSTSEQIKLAVDIAKLTSKDLKVICIDRFESLDNKTKKEFFEHIKDDDFQYFITEVADNEDVEIQNLTGEKITKDEEYKDEDLEKEAEDIFGW